METQFSLRDMLQALTLISIGAASWPLSTKLAHLLHLDAFTLLAFGGAFVGAGVGTIFHSQRLGVVCGFYAGALVATVVVSLTKS